MKVHRSGRRVTDVSGGIVSRVWIIGLRLLGLPFLVTRFRGSTRLFSPIIKHVGIHRRCVVRLSDKSQIGLRLNDLRWIYLLLPGFRYEASLEHCLRLFDDENYLLVDGGASIGYWSVLASENPRHAVVAVEPVGMTFEELQRNRKLNGERFECLRAALHDGTRARVQMAVDSERHGSSYVKLLSAPIDADRCLEEARVVTIDQVVAEADPASERPLILKLDVEGSEVAALQGASEALKADPLVIYEDHGTDRDARASQYILGDLGFVGYFIDDAGRILRMRDVNHVRAVKGGRNKGFNFFASRGGSRFDRILSKHAV